jgi:hypothetical protein
VSTTIIGIDPGLVHMGAVAMTFAGSNVSIESKVFAGNDFAGVRLWTRTGRGDQHVFIEAYRERGNIYSTDSRMRDHVGALRRALPRAKVVDNTGIKAVVKQPLMELVGVWRFAQVTHHQDLRAAARIGLYGALKDEELNRVVFDFVLGSLTRRP